MTYQDISGILAEYAVMDEEQINEAITEIMKVIYFERRKAVDKAREKILEQQRDSLDESGPYVSVEDIETIFREELWSK